jgi:O-methyltransferase
MNDLVDTNSIIYKAASFIAADLIIGDYLEFGVFQGGSIIAAHRALTRAYEERSQVNTWGVYEHDSIARRNQFQQMRYFAFDSFKGLPKPEGLDSFTAEFEEGKYACSEQQFLHNLHNGGVPMEKISTVPGFYEDSLKPSVIEQHKMTKAAIVWIDCDLYSSTKSVLDFIPPLMTDGTVFIFDDWFGYRGNPTLGEQRAWFEFTAQHPSWIFSEYQKEGPWRMSFIANKRF